MKSFICILLLAFTLSSALETIVLPLKDGYHTSTDLNGASKQLLVKSGGPSAWIAFDLRDYDLTNITSALLVLYVADRNIDGTISVRVLTETPALEHSTNVGSITPGAEIGTIAINAMETAVTLDITSHLDSSNFKGVHLEGEGALDVVLSSKEGPNRPFLLLKYPSSSGPTGSAGGALTGTYPDPDLNTDAVATDNIQNLAVTDDKISGLSWDKLLSAPTTFPSEAHNHSGDALIPQSLSVGSTANTPKIEMMTWTISTPSDNSQSYLRNLTGTPLIPCPNPDGIIHLSGILSNGDDRVPSGGNPSNSDYWDVKYEAASPNHNLRISHSTGSTQVRPITILCIYVVP